MIEIVYELVTGQDIRHEVLKKTVNKHSDL